VLYLLVGNIWDISGSSLVDDNSKFSGFNSLKNLCGSGLVQD
jgi:hypothetical protein